MKKWLPEYKKDEYREKNIINYKEFWAICIAIYKTVLPRTLLLAVSLFIVAMLINWFFS